MGKGDRKRNKNYQAAETAEQPIIITIWPKIPVGGIVLFLLGGGISFMNAGSPYIADFFFLGGAIFVSKVATWELSKEHAKVKIVQTWIIISTVLIVIAAIIGNHYLNESKKVARRAIAYIHFDTPRIVESSEFSTIGPGKKLGFNIVARKDPGSERIFDVLGLGNIYIEDVKFITDKLVRERFDKQHSSSKEEYYSGKIKGRSDLGTGHNIWSTVVSEPLTEKQCSGLFDGSTRIYIITWGAWKDAEGKMDTTYNCRWLQALTKNSSGTYSPKDFVWHTCQ